VPSPALAALAARVPARRRAGAGGAPLRLEAAAVAPGGSLHWAPRPRCAAAEPLTAAGAAADDGGGGVPAAAGGCGGGSVKGGSVKGGSDAAAVAAPAAVGGTGKAAAAGRCGPCGAARGGRRHPLWSAEALLGSFAAGVLVSAARRRSVASGW